MSGATEINCAAYRSENKITVSECERPYSKGEFLSFSDKYSSAKIGAGKEFPAKISEELSEKIKSITEKVYDELGFSGVIRVDYLVSDGKVFLNEINSVPGSLAYYLFCDKIAKFPSMLCALIEQAIADNTSNNNCVSVFDSDVLSFSGICLKK